MAGCETPAYSSEESNTSVTLDFESSGASASPVDKPAISRVARSRPREMLGQPGTVAAIFSTDGGRLPRRGVPIPPPRVIVRGVQVQGVVDSANYWRSRFPDFYHCLFPDHGWTITDLWDDYDIHLESPGHLEEVLRFIVNDNHHGAFKFAQEWCHRQRFSGVLEKLAGNFKHFENSIDRYSFVDDLFNEDELEVCPRPFLVHALWAVKQTMHNYVAERHTILTTDPPEVLMNSAVPHPKALNRAGSLLTKQQTPMTVLPRKLGHWYHSSPHDNDLLDPKIPKRTISSHGLGGQYIPSLMPVPPPPRPKLYYGAVSSLKLPAGIPAYLGEQVRNATKPRRSGSNPFSHPLQMQAYGENIRLPSNGHSNHLSGPEPHRTNRQVVSNLPIGPNIFPSAQAGLDYLPNATMTSSVMHPVQYLPMVAPATLQPSAPLISRFEDPAYQQFGSHGNESHVEPFADMANTQYPPMRAFNARPYPRQGSQSMKPSGLYNPYDATRPDKADFATTGIRKGSRGNFASSASRGRNYSTGVFDRAGSRSNEWDHPENVKKPNGSSVGKSTPMLDTKNFNDSNPNITKDKEFGCDHDFIGPKNSTVRQLYVRNLPEGTTGHEIRRFFEEHAAITPTMVDIKLLGDRKDLCNAFVYFNTTEDARAALNTSLPLFKGREVPVSVAKRNFQIGNYHRTTKQDIHGFTEQPNPYSPQDARSDLHHMFEQNHRPNVPISRGSPEERKRKTVPVNSAVGQKDRQVDIPKQENSSITDDPNQNGEDEMQVTGLQKDTIIVPNGHGAMGSASRERPDRLLERTRNGKEDTTDFPESDTIVAGDSGAASAETIAQSVTVNAHAPLLVSSTNVNLPPQPKILQVITQEDPETVIPVKDTPIVNAIVTPQVQENVAAEDGQRHNLEFHTAQESRSNVRNEKTQKKTVGLQCEHAVNDGTRVTEHMQSKEQQDQKTTNGCLIASESCKGKEFATSCDKVQGETGKKQGAKRTESLNPYSKASKAQLKKIKEKEKKQKKVREDDKKNDKGEMDGKGRNQSEIRPNNEKGDQNIVESAEFSATDDQEKFTRGKASPRIDISNHTEKMKAYNTMKAQEGEQETSTPPGRTVPPAAFPEEKVRTETLAARNGGAAFGKAPECQGGKSEANKKTRTVPPAIAIPSLELLKKKSSPTSSTTQPHTAYFTADSASPDVENRGTVNVEDHGCEVLQREQGMTDR